MAKKQEPARDATAPMFEPYADSNGVEIFCNAHPASDYGTTERLLDPGTPMARQVCDQVFGGSGQRMKFASNSTDPMKPLPSTGNAQGWEDMLFPSILKKGTR